MSKQQSRNAKPHFQPRREDKGKPSKGRANLHLVSSEGSFEIKKGKVAEDEAKARADGLFRDVHRGYCCMCKVKTDTIYAWVFMFWEDGETEHWRDRRLQHAGVCSGVCSREYDALDYSQKMVQVRGR